MSRTRETNIGKVDWITVGIFAFMVIFGFMNIYSATYNPAHTSMFDFDTFHGKQLIWIGVSAILAVLIMYVEGDFFNKFALPIYGFFTLLLVLVLLIGKEVNGAKAWFGVGDFGIQPSEFAKMATALMLAKYISGSESKLIGLTTRFYVAAIIGLPAALVLLQPDVGSVLVFIGFVFVLYREGLSGNILLVGLAGIVLGSSSIIAGAAKASFPFAGEVSGVWWIIIALFIIGLLGVWIIKTMVVPRNRKRLYWIVIVSTVAASSFSFSVNYVVDHVLKDHHKTRIYVLFGLELPPELQKKSSDPGYNARMAKATVGSGGLLGQGFMGGPMTRSHFVPEQWTDFIFSAVAEDWGFVGCLALIGLFVFLIFRLINMAERQRSSFSRIYGYGVASILFMHLLINVGMVIGLAPIIGIPLPFFSYGGSSLMAFTILIFIMLRLDAERLNIFK
ncbi:MAG: rod shape-determining protein RodA [Flavobacteriales bacterium]|nr:rod shape-determining protein RodA [Flavobacteriales bacterium]